MIISITETKKAMDKSIKKKPKYNQAALAAVQNKYGYGLYYIKQSINGTKTGVMPDQLKKEYFKACQEIEVAILKFSKK